MRIIMNVTVLCDDPSNKCVLGMMTKTIDTDCVPVSGAEIEDPVWHDARKIENVVLCPESEHYSLELAPKHLSTKEGFDELKTMYQSHEWDVL